MGSIESKFILTHTNYFTTTKCIGGNYSTALRYHKIVIAKDIGTNVKIDWNPIYDE